MRAASPPRQMEHKNEMIVISHRLLRAANHPLIAAFPFFSQSMRSGEKAERTQRMMRTQQIGVEKRMEMSLPERVRLLLRPRSPIGPKMRARTTAAVLRPILRMRYPMTPKMNMRTTSTKLLLMAKEPTTQRTKMHGMRMAAEILAMCAKMRQPPSPMRSMKNCTMTKPAKKV